MLAFIVGVVLVYSVFALAALRDFTLRGMLDTPALQIVFIAVVVPALCAWAAAELMCTIRGRRLRMFSKVHRRPITCAFVGASAGVLGAGASLAAMVLMPNPPVDALVMGAGGLLGPIIPLLLARSTRRGACPNCNYDLCGLTPASRGLCPECGLDPNHASGPSYTPPERFRVSESTLVRA